MRSFDLYKVSSKVSTLNRVTELRLMSRSGKNSGCSGTHCALSCDDPPKATITFVHTRVRILIRNAWKAHASAQRCSRWATEGGEGRAKVRCERSFLHLHLTHFTTLLFRQYNHFNNCLPSSAPPPPPLPPASVSTVRKDEMNCLQADLHVSNRRMKKSACGYRFQVLNKLIVFHQTIEFAKCWIYGILVGSCIT